MTGKSSGESGPRRPPVDGEQRHTRSAQARGTAGELAPISAVIVIPVYQAQLLDSETWNLQQSFATNDLPRVFVGPTGLDWSWYQSAFPDSSRMEFPAAYFTGTRAYSRLLLGADFYRPFERWTFQVLLQTDAILLRAVMPFLEAFGYDYAGAPWPEPWEVGRFSRYLPRAIPLERVTFGTRLAHVGNGGLSLRRVDAFVRALEARPLLRRWSRVNEDTAVASLGMYGALNLPPAAKIIPYFCEKQDPLPHRSTLIGMHAMERYHPTVYEMMRAKGAQYWLSGGLGPRGD